VNRTPVLPTAKARLLVRAFALAVVAQKAAEDAEWAGLLAFDPGRRALGRWIVALEGEAARVLVCAAQHARARRDGQNLGTVLHLWLGFVPEASDLRPTRQRCLNPGPCDGDRLMALDAVLGRPSWLEWAQHPLAYLRAAVALEAGRIARDGETGGRHWERISFRPSYGEGIVDEPLGSQPAMDTLAQDEMGDPERRSIHSDDAVEQFRKRPARPRPALGRLLAVAGELRAAGLSATEERLLRLLEVGIPPVDAKRVTDCADAVYVNLLQKARRRAAV